MNKKNTADKLGTKTIETKAIAKGITPFEDLVHLAAIGRLSLAGRQDIGAIILKKKDSFQIKFCFDCKGIHPSLPDAQVYPMFAGIEAKLKELPKGELLTLHIGSFTDDFDRQQTLKTIEENCVQDELKLLARSERLRMRELTQQGIRQTKFLRLYCTYTVAGAEETKTTDFVEKLMQGQKTWHQFTGQIHAVRFQRIETILKYSFHTLQSQVALLQQ